MGTVNDGGYDGAFVLTPTFMSISRLAFIKTDILHRYILRMYELGSHI